MNRSKKKAKKLYWTELNNELPKFCYSISPLAANSVVFIIMNEVKRTNSVNYVSKGKTH